MNKRRVIAAVVAVVVIAVGTFAWVRVSQADHDLTRKPERRAGGQSIQEDLSYISLPIRLRSESLSEIANEAVPTQISIPEEAVWSGRVGFLISATARAYGHVSRTSPIVIRSEDDGLTASTRMHGWVRVGVRHLGHETAEADANVTSRIRFDVTEDWKPVVAIDANYSWINRPIARLFGLFDLSLGSLAGRAMDREISKWRRELPPMVEEKLDIRGLMESAWKDAHTSIQLSESPATWLTVEPMAVHFLPPKTDNGDLLLNLGIASKLSVTSSKPADVPVKPLPNLTKEAPPAGGFRIAVPAQVSYEVIERETLAALKGKPVEVETPQGMAVLHVEGLSVYPAAPRLVVGVKVKADLPDEWLDTHGTVYLFAEPVYDHQKKALHLKNIEFSREVDNKVVRFLTAAMKKRIASELQKLAIVSLDKQIDAAMASVNSYLADGLEKSLLSTVSQDDVLMKKLASSVDVTGGVERIESVGFSLAENALTIYPVVSGNLAVELRPAATESVSSKDGKEAVGTSK